MMGRSKYSFKEIYRDFGIGEGLVCIYVNLNVVGNMTGYSGHLGRVGVNCSLRQETLMPS